MYMWISFNDIIYFLIHVMIETFDLYETVYKPTNHCHLTDYKFFLNTYALSKPIIGSDNGLFGTNLNWSTLVLVVNLLTWVLRIYQTNILHCELIKYTYKIYIYSYEIGQISFLIEGINGKLVFITTVHF